jgi:hypothetical protein
MIDKERLKEIKKELELDWSDISYVVNQDDVKWLINRVEELEKINKKLIESTTVVANENHRYKLALEFYANKKNYDIKHLSEDEHEIPVFKDYGEKARNALERDEN